MAETPILPHELPAVPSGIVIPTAAIIVDDESGVYKATPAEVVRAALPRATDAEILAASNVDAYLNPAGGKLLVETHAPVTSVNGKTGAAVLVKADVGLDNADNTSDAAKPISTATQAALDAKQYILVAGQNIQIDYGTPTAPIISSTSGTNVGIPIKRVTCPYTLTSDDIGTYIFADTDGADTSITVAPDLVQEDGTRIWIEQVGTDVLTIEADTGVTINSRSAAYDVAGEFGVVVLFKTDIADTWTLTGDLV